MYPELFELPIIHVTVKTYGLIMVIGFLMATLLMRRIACRLKENPDHITNAALYALLAGIAGARLFYVIHHFDDFRGEPFWTYFATWQGGLEFVGGVILAVIVILIYLYRQKLSVGRYMDILAIGLMLGLSFGRIGCFFSGCCWGKPTDVPWAIRFPYGADAYRSQVNPDYTRDRSEARLKLTDDYFSYDMGQGRRFSKVLKPFDELDEKQKYEVTKGQYRCLPIHPSQFYSSANALAICMLLYLFWRKTGCKKPGSTISLMFILYGLSRFVLEYLRDDNPFETGWWTIYNDWTVSQNLGVYMAVAGLVMIVVFLRMSPKAVPAFEGDTKKTGTKVRDKSGRFAMKKPVLQALEAKVKKTRDSGGRFAKKISKKPDQQKKSKKKKTNKKKVVKRK